MQTDSHPLLALLPVLRSAVLEHGGNYIPKRVLGVPHSIEVTTRTGHEFVIELDDDIPKHRSRAMFGQWVETDAASLTDDLADD